jgi:hypothetical protein
MFTKKTLRVSVLALAAGLCLQPRAALALRCDAKEPFFSRLDLIETLRKGQFSNALDVYTDFTRVGNIKVNEKTCFTFYYYAREFPAASSIHYSTRLLVFKNWDYVGMYNADGSLTPEIQGNAVIFPEEVELRKTVFDKDDPPRKVYINGAWHSLFK